jgi:hypothetical protein
MAIVLDAPGDVMHARKGEDTRRASKPRGSSCWPYAPASRTCKSSIPHVRTVLSRPIWLSAFGLNIARVVAKGRRGKRSRGAARSARWHPGASCEPVMRPAHR